MNLKLFVHLMIYGAVSGVFLATVLLSVFNIPLQSLQFGAMIFFIIWLIISNFI